MTTAVNAVIQVEPFKFLHKIGEGAHDYGQWDKNVSTSGKAPRKE